MCCVQQVGPWKFSSPVFYKIVYAVNAKAMKRAVSLRGAMASLGFEMPLDVANPYVRALAGTPGLDTTVCSIMALHHLDEADSAFAGNERVGAVWCNAAHFHTQCPF